MCSRAQGIGNKVQSCSTWKQFYWYWVVLVWVRVLERSQYHSPIQPSPIMGTPIQHMYNWAQQHRCTTHLLQLVLEDTLESIECLHLNTNMTPQQHQAARVLAHEITGSLMQVVSRIFLGALVWCGILVSGSWCVAWAWTCVVPEHPLSFSGCLIGSTLWALIEVWRKQRIMYTWRSENSTTWCGTSTTLVRSLQRPGWPSVRKSCLRFSANQKSLLWCNVWRLGKRWASQGNTL